MNIEVCVDSLESALIAEQAGANRIELCLDLNIGGTTPSYGLMKSVRKHVDIPIFTMIRPRSGDFCYTDYELEVMKEDIILAKELKMDGIVIGVLDEEGDFNVSVMREFTQLARPMKINIHRAFDMCRNPIKELDKLLDIGADRILTSGGCSTAVEGLELIKEIQNRVGDRISIMPGSGVNKDNVIEIIKETNVKEVHLSGKKIIDSRMKYRKDLGISSDDSEFTIAITDYDRIRMVRQLVDDI